MIGENEPLNMGTEPELIEIRVCASKKANSDSQRDKTETHKLQKSFIFL